MYKRKIKKGDKIYEGSTRVFVDLTPATEKKLSLLMERSGLKSSKVLNNLINKSKLPSDYSFLPAKKELHLLRLEVQKIGININQVAKKINSEKTLNRDIVIESYLQQIYKQEKKLIELSDKIEKTILLMLKTFS